MGKRRKQDDPDYVDPKKMIALEEEMAALKKEYGIEDKPRWWVRIGDFIANHAGTAGACIPKKISPFGPVSGLGRRSSVLYEAVCPGCYLSAVLLDRNSVCNDTD